MSPRDEPLTGITLFDSLTQGLLDGLRADIAQDADPLLIKYRQDPLHWMEDVLAMPRRYFEWSLFGGPYATHHWDGTKDPLATAAHELALGHNVAIESGTGTGKTFFVAAIVLWFLDCWRNSVVVTAAPTEKQLKLHLWKEMGQMFPRFKRRRPNAALTSLHLRMLPPGEKWTAVGFPVGVGVDEAVATKAAGFHEKDMLIITEETPGIKAAVMAAFEQTSVSTHNLRLGVGNPDHREDSLHRMAVSPGVVSVRASALDHPNVVHDDPLLIPGAVSLKSVEDRKAKYGERSPMYQSRVRGISPAQSSESLIQLEWLYKARDRGRELCEDLGIETLDELLTHPELMQQADPAWAEFWQDVGPLACGVDVANSQNGDLASRALGRGAILCQVIEEQCPDANAYARMRVETEVIRGLGCEPDRVGIDGVGVGSGAVNQCLGDGYAVRNLMGGAGADPMEMGEEEYLNLRAQMHWRFRLDAQYGHLILPDDEQLFIDLTTPTWKQPGDKKIRVEPKEHLRDRLPGKRSPNKGDSAVYWNWVRQVSGGFDIPDNAGSGISF